MVLLTLRKLTEDDLLPNLSPSVFEIKVIYPHTLYFLPDPKLEAEAQKQYVILRKKDI